MGFDSETSRILSHHSTNSAKKEITNNEVSRGGHAPTTVPTTIGSGAFPLYPPYLKRHHTLMTISQIPTTRPVYLF